MTPNAGRALAGPLALVHPFPSLLNAVVVFGIALLAGGAPGSALALALGMLGLQFSIGASNDVLDESHDRLVKPAKPIPAGRVRRRTAVAIAFVTGALGLTVAAVFGPFVLLLAGVMLGAGLAYNLRLKRGPFAWAAYSVALPGLPVYAWLGASGQPPPQWHILVAVAALAGPALQLANGLVDHDADRITGSRSPAVRLGPRRGVALTGALQLTIHLIAWTNLAAHGGLAPVAGALLVASGVLAGTGVALSAARVARLRERGWKAQAGSVGVLALGWLAGVSPP